MLNCKIVSERHNLELALNAWTLTSVAKMLSSRADYMTEMKAAFGRHKYNYVQTLFVDCDCQSCFRVKRQAMRRLRESVRDFGGLTDAEIIEKALKG